MDSIKLHYYNIEFERWKNAIIRIAIILVKLHYIFWSLKIQPVCPRYILVDHKLVAFLAEL